MAYGGIPCVMCKEVAWGPGPVAFGAWSQSENHFPKGSGYPRVKR